MTVQRLTKAERERIVSRVLSHRFGKEIEALVIQKESFALAVYNDLYPKVERDKMEALPQGWLPESEALGVSIGGRSWVTLYFSDRATVPHELRVLLPYSEGQVVKRRVKAIHRQQCVKVYEATHELAVRYEKILQQEQALQQQIIQAGVKLRAAVARATTAGGLLKLWPELAPFVVVTAGTPTQLPAIPLEELNKLFKLPVEKVAEKPTLRAV